MFSLGTGLTYQLYSKPCDMRKSFDGLSGIIRDQLRGDPLSGEVFIFLNRTGNLMKLLHWQEGGFVLYYKRLEKGTFTRPKIEPGSTAIKWSELLFMLEGIQVKAYVKKERYKLEKQASFSLKSG